MCQEIIVKRIIDLIFKEIKVNCVSVTQRLIHAFQRKLETMCSKIAKATNNGKIEFLTKKLKNGIHTEWQLKIYLNEIENHLLKIENANLQKSKRKLEEQICETKSKKLRIENELVPAKIDASKQKDEARKVKLGFKEFVHKVTRIGKGRGKSVAKNFADYSSKQKNESTTN